VVHGGLPWSSCENLPLNLSSRTTWDTRNDFLLAPREVLSIAAIAKLFTKLQITQKKCVHVATEQMSPHNRYCCQLYFQCRRTIDLSYVYFFGETHFNFETDERDYGRKISGLTCPSFRGKGRVRAGKCSTLAVCGSTKGVIQAIPVAGTLSAELLNEVIENQVLPLLPCKSFIVVDNACVHHEVSLCRINLAEH